MSNINKSKVLICGDSITKGVTFDENKKRYVNLENSVIKTIASKINLQIDNVSKFGNTVSKAMRIFKKAVEKDDYEYIVFELGGNDCDFNWKEVASNPTGIHNPNTDYNEYKEMLRQMISLARENGAKPILATLPPIDAHKYFDWISSFSNDAKDNILTWLGEVDRIYWWQERYNAAILQVAKEMECPLIDVRSAMLTTDDYRKYYCVDGIHPNAEGHKILSDAILTDNNIMNGVWQ